MSKNKQNQNSRPGETGSISCEQEATQPLFLKKKTKQYYSAIKKNAFESVLMRWIKLKPIIQSEVSQKDTHQYSILTHIYGI